MEKNNLLLDIIQENEERIMELNKVDSPENKREVQNRLKYIKDLQSAVATWSQLILNK